MQSGWVAFVAKMCPPKPTWKRRLVLLLIPSRAFYPLKFELSAAKTRLASRRAKQRFLNARDLKVNIGAGDRGSDGWVNIDICPLPGVTVAYDARRPLPFGDRSVAMIFTEHFLEHLNFQDEVPRFLAECYRILKPGGVIRIVVPDLAKYIDGYVSDGWERIEQVRGLGPDHVDRWFGVEFRTKGELLNFVARQWAAEPHLYLYDAETLCVVLRDAGFVSASESAHGQSAVAELALDNSERAGESLYVEAVR